MSQPKVLMRFQWPSYFTEMATRCHAHFLPVSRHLMVQDLSTQNSWFLKPRHLKNYIRLLLMEWQHSFKTYQDPQETGFETFKLWFWQASCLELMSPAKTSFSRSLWGFLRIIHLHISIYHVLQSPQCHKSVAHKAVQFFARPHFLLLSCKNMTTFFSILGRTRCGKFFFKMINEITWIPTSSAFLLNQLMITFFWGPNEGSSKRPSSEFSAVQRASVLAAGAEARANQKTKSVEWDLFEWQ